MWVAMRGMTISTAAVPATVTFCSPRAVKVSSTNLAGSAGMGPGEPHRVAFACFPKPGRSIVMNEEFQH